MRLSAAADIHAAGMLQLTALYCIGRDATYSHASKHTVVPSRPSPDQQVLWSRAPGLLLATPQQASTLPPAI
jgi:hypothetical protein